MAQRLEHVVVTGRTVGSAAVVGGTLTGPLDLGLGRVVPPTGRTFELPYVKVLECDEQGLAVRDHQHTDAERMIAQVTGAPPGSAA